MGTRSVRTLVLTLAVLLSVTAVVAAQAPKKAAPKTEQKSAAPATPPRQMTPAEIESALKAGRKILLIDVRSPGEFSAGHPQDALNVPLPQVRARMKQLQVPKPVEIVVVCRSTGAASEAVSELVTMGYSKAAYTLYQDWEKAGLKIEKSETPSGAKK